MNISRLAIKYSRFTIFLWSIVIIFGIFALSKLQYNLFPDVSFPVVIVRAQPTSEAISNLERDLTIPTEQTLQNIAEITDIESTTYPQDIVLNLIFEPGLKLDRVTADVNNTLKKSSIYQQAEWEIIPFNFNESTAISYVLLSDRYSLAELTQIAQNKLIRPLEQLPEVQKVALLGEQDKSLVRFNSQSAIALRVVKTAEGNTLNVVKKANIITSKLQQDLTDINIEIAETQAKYIKEATQATIDASIGAIIIAVVTIFVFLKNWQATLITAIAIPVSLLGTFIVMAIAGFNLETLTLLALALVIGIIVDDAIVEVENIIRYLESGYSPCKAAILATREIGFTVSVSTLTIVAVFLPIAFMGGTLGKFFRPFGLTVSAAVLTSLLVARTLSPVLAIYFLKTKQKTNSTITRQSKLINLYRKLLYFALNNRRQVIVVALLISLGGIALIPLIPQGFIPSLDRGEFNLYYQTPLPKITLEKNQSNRQTTSNLSWLQKLAQSPEKILLRRNLKTASQIEQKILAFPEVESIYTIAGYREQPNRGKIYIKLKSDRLLTTNEVQEKTRQALATIPNVEISVEDIPFVETGSDTPFKIALVGDNTTELTQTAAAIKQKITQLPSLADVSYTNEGANIPSIVRLNSERVVYLTANLRANSAIGDVTQQVIAIANPLLPTDVTIDTQGNSARVSKILTEFAVVLAIAVTLMLGILYLPFKRWLEPLVIGLSLPLAIIGSMLALTISQSDFGMISLIGSIFLLGLLDKNGILLMDYANQLRKQGKNRTQALIETGTIRLRPILMTTASTVLGMSPIALGLGAGAELRQPMAVTIIGGLITSSLLSLIVIPVLYSVLEDKSL